MVVLARDFLEVSSGTQWLFMGTIPDLATASIIAEDCITEAGAACRLGWLVSPAVLSELVLPPTRLVSPSSLLGWVAWSWTLGGNLANFRFFSILPPL